MSYITPAQYERLMTLPIALSETELRKQNFLRIATFRVEIGQRLEVSCVHLHLYKVLTPGVTPQNADSSLGMACVGLLASTMFSSAVGLVTIGQVGCAAWNADQPVIVTAPGMYSVTVLNNTTNVDLSVAVTGVARLYY